MTSLPHYKKNKIYRIFAFKVLKEFTRVWKGVCTLLLWPQPSERVVTRFLVSEPGLADSIDSPHTSPCQQVVERRATEIGMFFSYIIYDLFPILTTMGFCCRISEVNWSSGEHCADSAQHSAAGPIPIDHTSPSSCVWSLLRRLPISASLTWCRSRNGRYWRSDGWDLFRFPNSNELT